MLDPYSKSPDSTSADGKAVAPHDDNDLTRAARALYVGTAGDVVLITITGTTLTFKNVPAGAVLPVVVSRVKATGTTASDIVALY